MLSSSHSLSFEKESHISSFANESESNQGDILFSGSNDKMCDSFASEIKAIKMIFTLNPILNPMMKCFFSIVKAVGLHSLGLKYWIQ